MALNLFPVGYETEGADITMTRVGPIGYRNGIDFDYYVGDFVRDGQHRVLDNDGIESWKSWCINCMETQRFMHLAYNSDFGIDIEAAFRATSRAEAESILTREITEAIMADPYKRADYIKSLDFTWTQPDTVQVDAVIQGIADVTIDLTAYITRGGM